MASTIVTKNSSTASAVPVSGDLTQGELAVNVTDKKLYTKDSGGTVVKLVGGLGNQEANAVAITGGSVNGTTIGATTASTGAFTTLSASSTVSGTGFSTYLASPPAIGGTTAAAGSFTTLSASGNTTLSYGTANGVAYLNGSKVVTTGSALTFDGTIFKVTGTQRLQAASTGSTANGYQLDAGAQAHYWYLGSNTLSTFEIGSSAGQWNWANSSGEQMRLTSTGLGIGTSSPSQKLTVTGNGTFSGYVNASGGGNGFRVDGVLMADRDQDNNITLIGGSDNTLRLRTGSTARATIDSSGNLGLGVTSFGTSAAKVIGLANATAPTSSPAGMGQLYVEGGALKYRGSSGTVTTIANA